jgi:hypothetical protein
MAKTLHHLSRLGWEAFTFQRVGASARSMLAFASATSVLLSACERQNPPATPDSNATGLRSEPANAAPAPAPVTVATSVQPDGSPPLEFQALDTCAKQTSGPNVVILQCGAVLLKIMRPETINFDVVLSELVRKDWQRSEVTLGDKVLPGAVLRGQARHGVMVGIQHGSEPRFLSCFVDAAPNAEPLCNAALQQLVSRLPDIEFAPPALHVAGHALTIPTGCTQSAADRIRCATAELHWRDPSSECKQTAEETRAGYERILARLGKIRRTSVPCVVLGESLTCHKYVVEQADKATVTIILSGRGCAHSVVQCNLFGTERGRYPEPCDQVFSGKL